VAFTVLQILRFPIDVTDVFGAADFPLMASAATKIGLFLTAAFEWPENGLLLVL